MAILRSNYIILSAVLQNVLYIHELPNVHEIYVCYRNGGERDTHPYTLTQMTHSIVNSGKLRTFASPIPEHSKFYRLRIKFHDQTIGDFEDWRPLPNKQINCSDYKDLYTGYMETEKTKADINRISFLILYIIIVLAIIMIITIALVVESSRKSFQRCYRSRLSST